MKASPEQLYELFANRQSDRSYRPDPIPSDTLERIIENALLAPSACNQQPWSLLLVNEPDKTLKAAKAATSGIYAGLNKFICQAPALLFIVAEKQSLMARIGSTVTDTTYTPYDIGIFVAHLCLSAEAEGVGSCILGWINDKAVKKALNIPKEKKVVLAISLGYTDAPKRIKKRKSIDQVLHKGEW